MGGDEGRGLWGSVLGLRGGMGNPNTPLPTPQHS